MQAILVPLHGWERKGKQFFFFGFHVQIDSFSFLVFNFGSGIEPRTFVLNNILRHFLIFYLETVSC